MNEELEEYVLAHIDAEPEALKQIFRATNVRLVNPRMMSGHLQGRLLKMFCRMLRPRLVVELGTFSAYATLCLAEGVAEGGVVHTIEHNDELENFIKENLKLSPHGEKVKLHIGEVLEILDEISDEIDLAFIDADKRDYLKYYEKLLPKMRVGGVLIADNTLWSGKVLGKAAPSDAQTRALQEFNDFLATDGRIEKVIVPLRDGLTIIYKK